MTSYRELVWLHTHSYGKALRIKKGIIKAAVTFLCLITPATNWTLPFILPRIKDYTLRW